MFAKLARDCIEAFSYLMTEFGYRVDRSTASRRGFSVRFAGPTVGVEVAYQVRDPLTVTVSILDSGVFPICPGELSATTPIDRFDLIDIEVVSGAPGCDDLVAFSVPDVHTLGEYALRLRMSADELLTGDLGSVPALRRRILKRARAAAFDKWGSDAEQMGW